LRVISSVAAACSVAVEATTSAISVFPDDPGDRLHRRHRLTDGPAHATYLCRALLGRPGGLISEVLDHAGHHGEALAGFARTCIVDRRI
jgi:hypothetical protein